MEVDWQVGLSAVAQHPFPYMNARTTRSLRTTLPSLKRWRPSRSTGSEIRRCTQSSTSSPSPRTRIRPRQDPNRQLADQTATRAYIQSTRSGGRPPKPSRSGTTTPPVCSSIHREPTNALFRQTTTIALTSLRQRRGRRGRSGRRKHAQHGFVYDPQQIYPATITNAKLQTTQLRYDARHGVPTVVVDPNNVVSRAAFDGSAGSRARRTPRAASRSATSRWRPTRRESSTSAATGMSAEHTSGLGVERHVHQISIPGAESFAPQRGLQGALVDQERTYDLVGRLNSRPVRTFGPAVRCRNDPAVQRVGSRRPAFRLTAPRPTTPTHRRLRLKPSTQPG